MVEPHFYYPSIMHMGDCEVCGHPADSPNHIRFEKPEQGSHWTNLAQNDQFRVEAVSSHPVLLITYVTYRSIRGGYYYTLNLEEWLLHYRPVEGKRDLRPEELNGK